MTRIQGEFGLNSQKAGKDKLILVALTATLLTLVVYLPTLTCGFVSYDDPEYVLNNVAIRELNAAFFASVFTQVHIVWWMPLTWISLAIDYHVWGVNPFGYHLTNIVLHAANTGLVVVIAHNLLRGSRAVTSLPAPSGSDATPVEFQDEHVDNPVLSSVMLLLAGLLWGLHPLRVESVAWVTERKDVLNGLLTLGSMLCYLLYARKKGGGEAAWGAYLSALLLFGMSLMAKSVSVVLPLLFLLADWYPLGRWRRGAILPLLVEKIPFLLLSAAMTVLTFYLTSRSSYLVSYEYFPFGQRLVVSGNAIIEYLRLLLLPVGISPLHLIPEPIPFRYTLTTVAAAGLGLLLIVFGKKRWLLTTGLGFLLPLLPVLAFFQNGDQAFASRFTYLPAVAPSIAAAVFICRGYEALKSGGGRRIIAVACSGYLLFCIAMTVMQIGVWKDTATFWSRAIALDPSALFYKERGKYYLSTGNYPAAVADFSESINRATGYLRANAFNLYILRAEAQRAAGHFSAAVDDYSVAIGMYAHPSYYHARGLALRSLGRTREAEDDFRRAGTETGPIGWYDLPVQ